MQIKRLAALFCCGAMAVSLLAGCGKLNKNATAATFDGKNIELGLVNFIARLEQASYDDTYAMYFGKGLEVWSTDMYGTGTTMRDNLVEGVVDSLQEIYTLEKHMQDYNVSLTAEDEQAIADTVSAFLAANSKEALDALGADQAYVEEYLRLSAIQVKMRNAVKAEADTEVSDEEAKTSAYSYVEIQKKSDAEDADTVAADMEEIKQQAEAFAAAVKAGKLEDVAKEYEYTVNTGTFKAEDDVLDEALLTALKGLKEGAVSGLVETEESYYILRLDAETDEEATEATRKSIIEERQDDYYNEIIEGWKEDVTWTVEEKAVSRISFDNLFTTTKESTETEATEE